MLNDLILEGEDVIAGVNSQMMWRKVSGRSTTGRRMISGGRKTIFFLGGKRLSVLPKGGMKSYGVDT